MTKLHQHKDDNNDGKCDECEVEMCGVSKPQGAKALVCSRVQGHKGDHYDRHSKTHF